MRKCFTPWVKKTYQKKISSNVLICHPGRISSLGVNPQAVFGSSVLWELLRWVKGSPRQVVFLRGPGTVWALCGWRGRFTCPLACTGKSRCFFIKAEVSPHCAINVRARCWRRISSKSRCTRSLHGKMSTLRWFPGCSSVMADAIRGERVSLGLQAKEGERSTSRKMKQDDLTSSSLASSSLPCLLLSSNRI